MPPVRARAAVIMNANSGHVLAAVNPHLHLAMASTTKVMTAVLALERGNLDDHITVPESAFNFESDATVMGLHPGQRVTLRDLLYGLMLPSGADAANTIAIHYAGSEARWVQWMNQRAQQLGMHDTHYLTAHGLDTRGQYSSAYDLALLGAYASSFPDLMQIASTPSYLWNGHVLDNLNHVINWYPGADGIKPGFTNAAGLCQILDARRHGRHVVAAILNTPDMVIDARDLLNFGLRDFTWEPTSLTGDAPSLVLHGGQGSYYFVGSGHYVGGAFWPAYLADGGMSALGYPRTEPLREGNRSVQYFQNGALAQNVAHHVTRLAVGLTPIPTATPRPTPTATSGEGAITIGASPTPTRALPAPTATPKPSQTGTPPIAKAFLGYQHAHARWLGSPVSRAVKIHGDLVQTFSYGALASDGHTVWVLPIGDRLLTGRRYLPAHPGNVYPSGFAPKSLLRAIGWLSP